MTTDKKKNPADLTGRNLKAAKKVDALQELQIDQTAEDIKGLHRMVRDVAAAHAVLTQRVDELEAQVDRLTRTVHNPLGLQT